jgi:hypothetical protein
LTSVGFDVLVLVMFDADTSPEEAPPIGTGRIERQMRLLEELAEIGMKLARAMGDQALAVASEDATSPRAAELSLAFTQVARAVRQTLALEARLNHQAETAHRRAQTERRAAEADAFRERRRAQAVRMVQHAIEDEVAEPHVQHHLDCLHERLADPREDLTGRPLGAVVAGICRQLGLDPDWSHWQDEDWALEEGRTEAFGSPYVHWRKFDDAGNPITDPDWDFVPDPDPDEHPPP